METDEAQQAQQAQEILYFADSLRLRRYSKKAVR
jgi:hypothetical protein